MLKDTIEEKLLECESDDYPIFKKNTFKSMYYVIEAFVLIIILYYTCYKLNKSKISNIIKYPSIFCCLIILGIIFWGQFVLGHDLGHGSFSDYNILNKTLGVIIHGTLLVPFQQWRCSHRKHHKFTGHIENDEIFKPVKEDYGFFHYVSSYIAYNPFTWILYLLFGYPDESMNHFNPLYPVGDDNPIEETFVCILSSIFTICFAFGLYKFGKKYGFKTLFIFYFIPWMIFSYLLVMVTFLQHQNENITWKNDKSGWNESFGALQSVNRSYGYIIDYLTHDIAPYHQVHHLFPKIPHYNLKNAFQCFEANFPEHVNTEYGNPFLDFFKIAPLWKKNIVLKYGSNIHKFYE
tara:strand:- start:7988 stop:9034 length:1047 start_codon:yes stop_codon:yes gene_type:complete